MPLKASSAKALALAALALGALFVPTFASAAVCGHSADCLRYTLPGVRTEQTSDYGYDVAKLQAGNGGVYFFPYSDPVSGGTGYVLVGLTFRAFDGFEETVNFVMCQDLNHNGRCNPANEPFAHKTDSRLNYWEIQNARTSSGCTYTTEPIIVMIFDLDVQGQDVGLATQGWVEASYGVC